LLARVVEAREAAASGGGRSVPVLVKIAPDMDDSGLDDIAAVALGRGIDGLIVSNTTLARTGVERFPAAAEAGGLSGRPLLERSTIVLARMRQRLGPVPVLVGVGGVSRGADALAKIAAGADLVQLYTGLVYEGLQLPYRILSEMVAHLDATGAMDVAALRDTATDDYARRPISP
jgi:dihydroorotate dehydrogenase